MKNLWLSLAFCLTLSAAIAQQQIKGKVVDQSTNAPLIGAAIWAEGTGRGAVTDSDGNFTLSKLPDGKVTIRVSYLGYASVTEEITLPYRNACFQA